MGMPLDLIWLCVPGYLLLQAYVLARPNGSARWTAWAPLVVMAPLFAYAAISLANGSNLWPLPILFASPLACLYLIVVALANPTPAQTIDG